MQRILQVCTMAFFLTGTMSLSGQVDRPPADREATGTKARTRAAVTDPDTSYGRVKELTAGQKIVIDVDDAPDKSFDLADKDLTVKMAKGLKVGDTVKVVEHSEMTKTKSVMITKHSGGGVAHGDKDKVK